MIKSKEYYSANALEKLFYVSGIPNKYWDDYTLPNPSSIAIETYDSSKQVKFKRVDENIQKEWMTKLTTDVMQLRKNYLLGIGSVPTDHTGMKLACAIAKFALVQVHDNFDPFNVEVISSTELQHLKTNKIDILVIYNVLFDATFDRLQSIRDSLERHPEALRIVVIAGSNPVSFFNEKLHMSLNGAFYFRNIDSSLVRKV